jgi:hypothetical protein
MVSGSISLLCSRFFSPFPHGTGSLSVSGEYLALADGPAGFTQDFSCPALLRILIGLKNESCTGFSPSMMQLSRCFHFTFVLPCLSPTTPILPKQYRFGLLPFRSPLLRESLFVFSSYGYLDVSVPHVCLPLITEWYDTIISGCPIRKSADRFVFANPRSLSQLITSFFAFQSLGIPHVPLFTFFSPTGWWSYIQ